MDFLSMSQDSTVTCLSISAKVGTLVTPQADFSSMATYHPAIGSMFYINWTWFYFTISSFCQLLKQQLYCKHTADKNFYFTSPPYHWHPPARILVLLEWCFGNFIVLFTNLLMNRAVYECGTCDRSCVMLQRSNTIPCSMHTSYILATYPTFNTSITA